MNDNSLTATYRILDASANRAGEGLRTMEEYARFVLNDGETTSCLKSLRHELAGILQMLPREALLSARDTAGDVGTEIREETEYRRANLASVVLAAAARTQQSLRVLEEYGKTIDASVAGRLEQLRYRCYTASSHLELHIGRVDRVTRLQQSHLYVLIDAGKSEQAFADQVELLARGAVDVLQLRDRSVDDRTLLHRGRLAVEITRRLGKLFIMNDRADLAVAADADGVHVGQEELPAVDARRIIGPNRLVGVSTHSIRQARDAVGDGADYIGVGPVFPGRTKSFEAYVGTVLLEAVAKEIRVPCFAIGGIDGSNVNQVIATGFRRIAVTGAVRDADDPVSAANDLRDHLNHA